MAEDSVQQIVQSSPVSAINAHPSLVQQRRQERRREKRDDEGGQEGKEGADRKSNRLEDRITLSENGRSASAGAAVAKHPESSEDAKRSTIDIRI